MEPKDKPADTQVSKDINPPIRREEGTNVLANNVISKQRQLQNATTPIETKKEGKCYTLLFLEIFIYLN